MKKKCCVKKCEGNYESWIDIVDRKENKEDFRHGRFPFCKKHFDVVMPYLKAKEKELKKQEEKETGEKVNWFWAWAPVEYIEEALNQ